MDEQLSDEIAVMIAAGTYVDSGARTASNSYVVQCVYKNPNLTLMEPFDYEEAPQTEPARDFRKADLLDDGLPF